MWVTNSVPHNKPSTHFQNSAPFHALILLDAKSAPKACDFVRDAEGPRHINIVFERIGRQNSPKRLQFVEFLKELQSKILELAPEQKTTEIIPDFFDVTITGAGISQGSHTNRVTVGKPSRVLEHNPTTPREEPEPIPPGPVPKPPTPSFRRQGRRAQIKSAITRRNNGIHIFAKPLEDMANAEVRVVIKNGADSTCDNPDPDEYLQISEGATFNGTQIQRDSFHPVTKKRMSVFLGQVSTDEPELEIWLPCRTIPQGELKAEFVHREKQSVNKS